MKNEGKTALAHLTASAEKEFCAFLAQQTPLLQQFDYANFQFVGIERFLQESISTRIQSTPPIFFLTLRRYYDNRYMVQYIRMANLTAKLITVHLKHHQIRKNQIGHILFCFLQSFITIAGIQ